MNWTSSSHRHSSRSPSHIFTKFADAARISLVVMFGSLRRNPKWLCNLGLCNCALYKFTRQYVKNSDKCIDAKGISWTQFSVLCQLWDKSQLQFAPRSEVNVHWHPEKREERGEALNHGRRGNIRKWEYKWKSREFINYVKEVAVLFSCGQRAINVNVDFFERLRRFDEISFLRAGELRLTRNR